jgi:hypothetical protein
MADHLLADILGAVIGAAVRSEKHSATATVEFMREVGFIGGRGDDWGRVRYVRFVYPAIDGHGKRELRRMRVPLLSLVPVPLQQAREAEYEFFFRVSGVSVAKEDKKDKDGKANKPLIRPLREAGADVVLEKEAYAADWTAFGPYIDLVGQVAPYMHPSAGESKDARIRIKYVVRQSDLPAGVASTLRRLSETSGDTSGK